jgi:hypothetical protein
MRGRVALLVLAIGCAASPLGPQSPSTSLPAGWRVDPDNGDLVHVVSAFHFAQTQRGCDRVNPHAYDESGENVSVGYNCRSRVLWLTVYVYPTGFGGAPSPRDHFRQVISDVVAVHAGAALDRATEMDLPLGSRNVRGFNAFLHWTQAEGEIGSFLVLIPDGPHFVKVRTSFLLDGTGAPLAEAWQLTLSVLHSAAPPP